MTAEILAVALLVIDAIERLGGMYSIGGSLASAFAGEPRSTLDVDMVVALRAADADALADALEPAFYLDRERLRHAIERRGSVNVIHIDSAVKIDLFVAGGTSLDNSLLRRRRLVRAGDPPREIFIHSPEDILLQKLRWFRMGGEVSERQWRDVLGIIDVQGAHLDRGYLADGAATLGISDLLQRAFASRR